MAQVLFAVGWDGFVQAFLAIVATLVWAILHFGLEKIKPKDVGQPRPQRPGAPPVRPQKPAGDPLQAEIDEFLKKAQALREGRPGQPAAPAAPTAAARQPQRPAQAPPARRPRPQRQATKQDPSRQGNRPPQAPVVVEVVEAKEMHESVAEHVAQHLGGLKFERRESAMSQMQGESDTEFSQHMARVFSHEIGTLKTTAPGIFTPAAAAAVPAMTAETSRSATAPVVVRKAVSDIAMFLTTRRNLRDAVILSEILRRPEDRW